MVHVTDHIRVILLHLLPAVHCTYCCASPTAGLGHACRYGQRIAIFVQFGSEELLWCMRAVESYLSACHVMIVMVHV